MIGSLVIVSCGAAAASERTIPLAASGSDDAARGAAVALAFMGLCSVVLAVTRATAVRRTFVTSRQRVASSVELLRAVVRRQRARTLAFAGACVLAGIGIAELPTAADVRVILGVTPGLMLVVALVSAWQLHRMRGLGPDAGVDVTSHGGFLYVARSGRLIGWVAAPPSIVADVCGLPLARARMHGV